MPGKLANKFANIVSGVLGVFLFSGALLSSDAAVGKDYGYLLNGSPVDANVSIRGGLVLEGGAEDSEEAIRWLIGRSGGGDIVVLRASEDDGTQEMFPALGNADSVETFIFGSAAHSFNPFIIRTLDQADGIFFAGGDQSRYIGFWKNTPVLEAVNRAIKRGVPVGGISAGLAILGQFQFEALRGSITSDAALKDPYAAEITLGRDFIDAPPLRGVITDSHFSQRGRLGRLLVFMARLVQDGWANEAKGIGVDEETAVIIDDDGMTRVTGKNEAVFVRLSNRPRICRPGKPLTAGGFEIVRVGPGRYFDTKKWKGEGRAGRADVRNGVITGLR